MTGQYHFVIKSSVVRIVTKMLFNTTLCMPAQIHTRVINEHLCSSSHFDEAGYFVGSSATKNVIVGKQFFSFTAQNMLKGKIKKEAAAA